MHKYEYTNQNHKIKILIFKYIITDLQFKILKYLLLNYEYSKSLFRFANSNLKNTI
jgi:hypothetical protein